jgi:hypothetical protein
LDFEFLLGSALLDVSYLGVLKSDHVMFKKYSTFMNGIGNFGISVVDFEELFLHILEQTRLFVESFLFVFKKFYL